MALVTQSEYARHIGKTPQYVYKLVRRGKLVTRQRDGKTLIDREASDRRRAAEGDPSRQAVQQAIQRAAASPRRKREGNRAQTGGAPQDPQTEMLLRTKVANSALTTRMLEIKVRKQAGELVDRKTYEERAFRRARLLRDAILTVPDRLAAILAAETDHNRVHRILSAELRTALQGLADDAAGRD